MYLAIDPGETTGWAHFGPEGYPQAPKPEDLALGQVAGQEALTAFLEALETPPGVVICERFRVLGNYKIHFGKELITVQNIGIIKSYAWRNNSELVMQDPDVKDAGYGMAGLPKASSHSDSHRRDALAHGTFYIIKNKIRPFKRPK